MVPAEQWFKEIKNAKKTCIIQNNIKKVHYLLSNSEMVEEYSTDTGVLLRRAWKTKTNLGAEGSWEVEIGDPEPKAFRQDTALTISESSNQPFITRRITKRNLEWRIRNLPYPVEIYSVKANKEMRCIVVSTSNKKYFKRLPVPELDRVGLLPEQENIDFTHQYNTLIITYKKPQQVLELENEVMKEIHKVKPITESEANCTPS